MRHRMSIVVLLLLLSVSAVTLAPNAGSAQQSGSTAQSAMLWYPSLAEAGDAIAGLVNQIDAGCAVDVDPVVSTNGAGPEGAVYAFAVTWGCADAASADGGTWLSSMLWYPNLTDAGDALAGLINQIDASCTIDTDRVASTNGAGPEGIVYAFAVTWSCPGGSGATSQPANAITVTIRDFSFTPSQLSIPANVATPVTITNEGANTHTFSIDEFELSLELAPGESTTVTLTALPGEYAFYCAVPGHRDGGMEGTLSAE